MMIRCKTIGICIATAGIFLTGCTGNREAEMMKEDLFRVGENVVIMEDFCALLEKHKSEIYNYFTQIYNVQPGDLVWDKAYGDTVPVDMLIEETSEKLLQDLFVLEAAEKDGLVASGELSSVRKLWLAEKNLPDEEKSIYGPEEKEYYEYYDYYLAELEHKVKENLWEDAQVQEAAIEEHYEQTKEENYRKERQWEGFRCYVETTQGKEMDAFLESYRQEALNTNDVEALIREVEASGIYVEEISTIPENEHYNTSVFPELLEALGESDEGDVTEIVESAVGKEFAIVTGVSEEPYFSLEEVRETVVYEMKRDVFEVKFEEWKLQNQWEMTEEVRNKVLRYLDE